MPKIKTIFNVSNVETWEDLRKYTAQINSDIVDTINGRISLVDNCDTQEVSVTFAVAATDVAIPHTLGRVPVRFLVSNNSTGVVAYVGAMAWTDKTIYLRATGAGVLSVILE